jgi:hypothetical protein
MLIPVNKRLQSDKTKPLRGLLAADAGCYVAKD